jgi:diguanylate cyclase (GGDEF)-like protein
MEVRQRRRDGTVIWVRLSGRAADVADPRAGRIWIVQDVTAQHDAQVALARTRAELEQRVRERTADIQLKNRALEAEICERRAAEEALREKTERLNVQTTRLLALAQADKSDFEKALDEILGTAIATLAVDFASYWRMREDGRSLCCERQYFAERGPVFSSAGTLVLDAAAHPAYFEALQQRHVIAADEARTHPATASLTPSYLGPLDITSSLVLPVWLDGRVVGVVSLDSRREPRHWTAEDVDFASGTAVITALTIEAAQRRRAEKRLQHLAHHDTLTGLPNRNLLDDRLRQAVALASRQGSYVAVMFLDLDRFKTINDSLGHLVGDRLLAQVAARLAGALRAGDTIARLGGDEFVVVLPGVKGPADAATVAGHLMQRLAPCVVVDGRELHVSASIGISLYPGDGQTVEALMRSADTAMYHAKDAGGNAYQFYAATMKAAATLRLDVETELRAALKRGELELHYQPTYAVATMELKGLEALVRWRHPRGEVLMPSHFVPVAEETGLIHEIGRWSLATACAQLRHWQEQGFPVVPVSVNLSARQFRERDFAESVRNVLARSGLDARMLDIEITEGALMQHSAETSAALRALAQLGVRISIDDFGVGYSNLVYLKRFAIDRIKIDQSFVRDIPAGGDDAVIAAAIISMARTLKLHVVAEGVENGAQLAFLAAHGCDEAQGTLLCPPLPPAATDRIFGPPRL